MREELELHAAAMRLRSAERRQKATSRAAMPAFWASVQADLKKLGGKWPQGVRVPRKETEVRSESLAFDRTAGRNS